MRAYKGFIQCRQGLCFCVLYEPQELCAVRAYKGFALLCTVRAPRALRGASLQRLCAFVCCTSPTSFSVRVYKDFIPCAPGLCFCVLYEPHGLCAVRAYKGFIQCAGARPSSFGLSAYVLVRSYEQMSSCTSVHMYRTSSHVICCSVREPVCLYVAERSIHVELVRLCVFCEHPQSRTI